MELPALRALRRELPDARIIGIGAAPAPQILEGEDVLHHVENYGRWGFRHRWDRGQDGAAERFRAWLEEQRFDLLLDFHHAPIGIARQARDLGFSTIETDEAAEKEVVREGGTGVRAIASAVRSGWGIQVDEPSPEIRLSDDEVRCARRFLRGRGIARAPIGIGAVASLHLKRWPEQRLSGFVRELERQGYGPFLVFTGPEVAAAERIRSELHGVEVHVIGALHLRRIAALLAHCRAFVSYDTGLMHISAAVGTPTVGIFGPTQPAVYLPPGEHVQGVEPNQRGCVHRRVQSLNPPDCFGAEKCFHEQGPCIEEVSVEQVGAKLQLLEQRRVRRAHAPRVVPGGRTGPCAAADGQPLARERRQVLERVVGVAR